MLRCPKPWPWFMLGIVGKPPMSSSHTIRCFVMFRVEICRARRVTLNNFVIENSIKSKLIVLRKLRDTFDIVGKCTLSVSEVCEFLESAPLNFMPKEEL
jgi:hypothetical protein